MTTDQLKAMKARCKAATEGPWKIGHHLYDDGAVMCRCAAGPCTPDADGKIKGNLFNANFAIGNRENDNSFVAHARTDLPACIKEIERLKKLVEDAYYEGGSIATDFAEQFDEDNSLWLDSESSKALEPQE